MALKKIMTLLPIMVLLLISHTYSLPAELEMDKFIKTWYLLGPVPYQYDSDEYGPEDPALVKEILINNYLSVPYSSIFKYLDTAFMIDGREYFWTKYTSDTDYICLRSFFSEAEHRIAYLYTEVNVSDDMRAVIGLGSNNAVACFFNDEMVFFDYDHRIALIDDDLFLVNLQKGTNKILLKIQNDYDEWGLYFRFIREETINERLRTAAYNGQLDSVERLLSLDADINAKDELGLTPLMWAKIAGRDDTIGLLIDNGADKSMKMPPGKQIANAYLMQIYGEDTPGVSVIFSKDGEILYHAGFGNADIGNRVPFKKYTKSRIGSITKQFVSAAILKLLEEGKLKLDDDLHKFLPAFPRGDEVTIHHLLSHTSGIRSYTGKQDFIKRVTSQIDNEGLLEYFIEEDYDFNPGEGWLYNNSGYFLLGYIVELTTGKTLEEYLNESFFGPIGMEDTGIHDIFTVLENEAYGYAFRRNKYHKAINWNMSWAAGAGAIYSTVYDLYLWNEALFNGQVLDMSSLDLAWTPVVLDDGSIPESPYSYGYGWAIKDYRGIKVIEHGGGLHGFLADLKRFVELDATVAVLQNCSPPPAEMVPSIIGEFIAEVFLWEHLEEQGSARVSKDADHERYDDFEGYYELTGSILRVRRDKNRLFVRLGFQDEFELYPSGENEFFLKVVDARVLFKYDDGIVNGGILYQGGLEINFRRLDDIVPVEIDTSIYQDYAGDYDLSVIKINISDRDGRLFLQAEGQMAIEMFPRSETEFFSDRVLINISFSKDDKGMKMSLKQMGMKFEGYRQ